MIELFRLIKNVCFLLAVSTWIYHSRQRKKKMARVENCCCWHSIETNQKVCPRLWWSSYHVAWTNPAGSFPSTPLSDEVWFPLCQIRVWQSSPLQADLLCPSSHFVLVIIAFKKKIAFSIKIDLDRFLLILDGTDTIWYSFMFCVRSLGFAFRLCWYYA